MTQITEQTNQLETIRAALDNASANRVFGKAITRGDVTVLPVAKVVGGAGGGNGTRSTAEKPKTGAGGGVGLVARGLGVFVLKDDTVSWRPAVDVNRVILGGQIVAIVAFLMARTLIQARGGTKPGRRRPRVAQRFGRNGQTTIHVPRRRAKSDRRRRRTG